MIDPALADALVPRPGLARALDGDERPTAASAHDGALTEEHQAAGVTLSRDPLSDSVPTPGSFEHRRIVSEARRKLFGARPDQVVRVGRYVIEHRLGSGGMGDVYLARDEALDRKVAIKRVRTTSPRERDQERLRREARALARLSHPNVVQVYEVDEHEGRTFLAMEYVAGQTLGAWLAEEPRPWRAVLERFMAAGRGLCAAHEAGLVHRDFKPDNVLLGHDGSVRVADFGLVLADRAERPADADPKLPGRADARLSRAGSVLGTIRYMSLEQLSGGEVDARSDQFAFCVALYEAVWKQPPFSLASSLARVTELQTLEAATPRPRPGSHPPAALWRVVRRGLRRDPAARWPDMGALLAALVDVTRRRQRLAIATTAITLVAAGLGAVMTREPASPCRAVEHELRGAWDDDRRAALATQVAALDASHVADSQQRIIAGLDRWAEGFTDARMQVCEAQAAHRIEPTLARDRSACLARQRQRVGDLVELLLQPGTDADALAGAIDAVAELPPATACEDEPAGLDLEPPPAGLEPQIEGVRRDVGRAHELRLLGRLEEGRALADQAETEARALGYGPLLAEALAERAKAEVSTGSTQDAVERLQAAIDAAERHHHDRLAAELWSDLAVRTLTELDDAQAGAWQLRRAEVANDRVGAGKRAHARTTFARGQLAELRADRVEAERSYRAALGEAEQDPAATPDLPSYLSNLARVVGERDPTGQQALALHERALAIAEEHYGPSHPQTAAAAFQLGRALQDLYPERAARSLRRAADIWATSHGHPNEDLTTGYMLLVKLALNQGHLDEAEHYVRRLEAAQSRGASRSPLDEGDRARLLAVIFAVRGEHGRALEQDRIALSLWEPHYGPEHVLVQRLHSDAAAMLLALGRLDEASAELDSLLPLAVGGPEETSIRLHRCEVALRRGLVEDASVELRAIPGHEASVGPHELSYSLLRALVDLRLGVPPSSLTRLADARASTRFTAHQLRAWYDQLGMTAEERATLSID